MPALRPLIAASLGLALTAAAAPAATLLAVDFDSDYAGFDTSGISATQAGFESAVVGIFESTPLSFTYGPYTVTTEDAVSDANAAYTQSGSRKRPGGDASVADLYGDFVFANSSNNYQFGLKIAGLDADTDYDVTFWAYNGNASAGATVLTQVGAPTVTDTIAYTNTMPPDDLSDFSTTLTATADATGTLYFNVSSPTASDAVLNGFLIADAAPVPEPASAGLVLGGLGLLLARRRRAL